MKNLVRTSLAFALTTAVMTVPVQAQDASQDIIVQPTAVTYAQAVGQRLDRQLDRGNYPGRVSGIVRVSFTATANGQTENVRLFERSGDARVDHAARIAVERLNGLGRAPLSERGDQDVMATIVFARNEREAGLLIEQAQRENEAIWAAGRVEPTVLAITVIPASRS